MFSRLRELWHEARASELRKDVMDAVHRLRSAGNEVNKNFAIHATTTQRSLETKFGRFDSLPSKLKRKIGKDLRNQARSAFSQDTGRAYALFFLGAYLDALTLPGSDAIFVRAMCASLLEPETNIISGNVDVDPIQAIKSGNLADFRQFIQTNSHSLNIAYEPNHWTLLHWLASLGSELLPVHSTMALELINAGADVNCRTPLGWTPLIMIAIGGENKAISLTKILIEHGADVGAVDKSGADWQLHWQHGKEIRAILDAAMTPAQKEANRLLLEQLYSPKR